jgi:hypothetical protein
LRKNGQTSSFLWKDIRFKGARLDYGLLHELTHHLPVGDNYTYNPGSGRGFSIEQPNGKTVVFPPSSLSFMANDHMASPATTKLTSASAYYINFNWQENPKYVRNPQHNPYLREEIYGNRYFENLYIRIGDLKDAGISNCSLFELDPTGAPQNEPIPLKPSLNGSVSLEESYNRRDCVVTMSRENQRQSFPGIFVGLRKDNVVFPVYLPRNLMEALYWSERFYWGSYAYSNFTFYLNASLLLAGVITEYFLEIENYQSQNNVIDASNLGLVSMFFDNFANQNGPTIFQGYLNDFTTNAYIIKFDFNRAVGLDFLKNTFISSLLQPFNNFLQILKR